MCSMLARTTRYSALAASSLLLLAACGGGGGDSGADVVTADPPPPPAQPAPPPPPPPAEPNPPAPEVVLADTYTDLVAGTRNSLPHWPAWVAPVNHAPVSGVACLGTVNYHKHSLITIYSDGVRLGLPNNVGRSGCTYELHTHDLIGMVHMESDVAKKFTLGQFFALWNQPLAASGTAGLPGPIRFYLIANDTLTPYTGDPAQLELVPYREIVIISGTAPAVLPKYRWPSGL